MRIIQTTFLFFLAVAFFSCNKPEGEGGKGGISGIVSLERYDHNNQLVNTEIAKEETITLSMARTRLLMMIWIPILMDRTNLTICEKGVTKS
ncbi:MAG: hypothetical protein JKY42_03350 [Flavobacteriales bacterium]|nr:hypothetical protein [Flavobacteriales bacterium]